MEKLVSVDNRVEIEKDVIGLFLKSLSVDGIDARTNFLDVGGDSLTIMTVIVSLEEKYSVELDPRMILAEPTAERISKIILQKIQKTDIEKDCEVDLVKEAVLDTDICPQNVYEIMPEECRSIFITGATGFLGAFLIKELLEKNEDIKLYCHVRCYDKYDGLERIQMNMKRYGCWDKKYKHRIEAIPGDLKKPKLGIADEIWQYLCDNIDMIYHNGAVLNFLYPYSVLRSSNVDSTKETLKLACTKKAKYYNYISSYSVYDNPSHFGRTVSEDDSLSDPEGYFLGYSQTKWVSEKLIQAARGRGLRTMVFRPGDITGTKESGIWEARDLTSRMIIGCIQMKVVPFVDMPMNFTPVDYVARAITHISFKNDSFGKAYNIINPEIGSSAELLKAIYSCGLFVMPIPYKIWKNKLNSGKLGANVLKILACMFESSDSNGDIINRHGDKQPVYDMTNTENALKGSKIKCDPMDASLLKSYIKYFKRAGMFN